MPMRDKKLMEQIRRTIASYGTDIEDLFIKSHGVMVTILVRDPSQPDGDILVTNDKDIEILAALKRLMAYETGYAPGVTPPSAESEKGEKLS